MALAALPILDSFWKLKGYVYHNWINSKLGILADYICQDYMRTNKLSFFEDYFYFTDRELEKIHPRLFSTLRKLAIVKPCQSLPNTSEIIFNNRTFHINKDVLLDSEWAIDRRYTQTKDKGIYKL